MYTLSCERHSLVSSELFELRPYAYRNKLSSWGSLFRYLLDSNLLNLLLFLQRGAAAVALAAAAAVGVSRSMRRLFLIATLAIPASRSAVEVNCNIFDETMICDNAKGKLRRAEIRTCSG